MNALVLTSLIIGVTVGQELENRCGSGSQLPCDCPAECIVRNAWCNGNVDCEDESDEKYCKTKSRWDRDPNKCKPSKHFMCGNGVCIPAVARCDKYYDCTDASDEINCSDDPDTTTPYSPATLKSQRESKRPVTPTRPQPTLPYNPITFPPRTPPVTPKPDPQWPMILRPQVRVYSIYRHPGNCPASNKKKNRLPPLLPFHFNGKAHHFGHSSVEEAKSWLIQQRDSSYGWGKDTPRALVALSLADNAFDSSIPENALMRRRLKLELGGHLIKGLKKNAKELDVTRLSMYINALLATCQDPRDVYGKNLGEMLYNKNQELKRKGSTLYPYVYITLCLVDTSIDEQDLSFLTTTINSAITDEVSKDRFILATTALACFSKTKNYNLFRRKIDDLLDVAADKLVLQLQLLDGSFGSLYSTALAAQTFNVLDTKQWQPGLIYDILLNNQTDDGSFGDFLATYYALPAISGRSLVHLRNTKCNEPQHVEEPPSPCTEICNLAGQSGFLKNVKYTVMIGYPVRSAIAIEMTVPEEFSFFDIMRIAQCADARFRFLYTENPARTEVFSIANTDNDPERDLRWQLFILDEHQEILDLREHYLEDIRKLIPINNNELLYWYHFDTKSLWIEDQTENYRDP